MTVVINGTSGYIADFSNATVASRQTFQTSTTNGSTGIYALPNGTSTAASWQATNNADPTNASKILIATNGSTDVQLVSGINGTGTYLPLSFYTSGAQKMQLDVNGNLLINGASAVTGAKLSVTGGIQGTITSGTAVASTSGTSIDFTNIPSWVKRITVMFSNVSTNGSSIVQIQIGSGSVTTSGYKSTSSFGGGAANQYAAATSGFITDTSYANLNLTRSGAYTFSLFNSNTWVGSGNIGGDQTGLVSFACSGVSPALGGALDRVRITTVNGTDTFDLGSINILYEG